MDGIPVHENDKTFLFLSTYLRNDVSSGPQLFSNH